MTGSTADVATITTSLRQGLTRLWRFGSNALVAWTPSATGIEILTVPTIRLFEQGHLHRRIFAGDRLASRRTFAEIAEALNIQPIEFRLAAPVGASVGEIPIESVEGTISPFTVTRTEQRAVFLIDIVGFSKLAPEQQASQLTTMEFALNLASEMMNRRGDKVSLHRSTTGDGFYVWNADKGLEADVALFGTMALFLTFIGSLKRTASSSSVPTVRTCFGIGSHYTYRQPNSDGLLVNEFIVGDVTISLARLIDTARANQILVGGFTRRADNGGAHGVAEFLELALARLSWMQGFSVLGATIDRITLYLTGPRAEDGGFRAQRLRVVDKHGIKHDCFNLKLNVFPSAGEPFYYGLQHTEL